MEESDDENGKAEDIVKTFAPPEVLAAILDEEESLETGQKYADGNGIGNDFANTSWTENREIEQEMTNNGYFIAEEGRTTLEVERDEDVHDSIKDSLEFGVTDSRLDDDTGSTTSDTRSHVSAHSNASSSYSKLRKEPREEKTFRHSIKVENPKRKFAAKPFIKPKINFLDVNKKDVGKRSGQNGYAALYRQKVKLKHSKDNKRESKEAKTVSEEKVATGNAAGGDSFTANQNSEQYDNFSPQASSTFVGNRYSTYPNGGMNYYSPENSYSRGSMNYNVPPPVRHAYQVSGVESQYQYINQPYQSPYRDFGLRYSNYGQQSYQTSSASTYPRYSQRNTLPSVSQMQGYESYASQSAPPGIPHYARQPLINQVEFFPEHDYLLSLTLPNSHFVNAQQRFQNDSVLQRNYVSEPHLLHSPLPDTDAQDRRSKASQSYASPRQPVEYKPYTLRDYRQIKDAQVDQLGTLGPNTDSEVYRDKINKMNKQKEYAEILRNHHSSMKKHWEKKATPLNITPARQKQAEAKRQAAINYAKTVPKPKIMLSRWQSDDQQENVQDEEKEVTLVELLRMRHEKEKNEVDVIRKDVGAKIRQ